MPGRYTNVFLVGLMGAGKTTVGRRLATAMGLPFADSDQEIERRTGAPIPLIFELEGEAGFRSREKAAIDALTQRQGIVLATGGGAVLDPTNRAHLRNRGWVVYLHAGIDRLLERTAKDRNRPLLQTADPRATLEALFQQRDPLYREIADLVISTDSRSVPTAVEAILEHLEAEQRLGTTRPDSG